MTEPIFKVGDEVAFQRRTYGPPWDIFKVERITPTGRMVAGPYTMNPNGRVRSRDDYLTPWEGQPVTARIRQELHQYKLRRTISNWVKEHMSKANTAQLERIVREMV